MSGALKQNSPGCACCEEKQCYNVCTHNTLPQSINVNITGIEDGESECDCTEINGIIEHGFERCWGFAGEVNYIHYLNYANQEWCSSGWFHSRWARYGPFITYYGKDKEDNVVGDLRARYEIWVDWNKYWSWNNVVSVLDLELGPFPIDCGVFFSRIDFCEATNVESGKLCSRDYLPVLEYKLG